MSTLSGRPQGQKGGESRILRNPRNQEGYRQQKPRRAEGPGEIIPADLGLPGRSQEGAVTGGQKSSLPKSYVQAPLHSILLHLLLPLGSPTLRAAEAFPAPWAFYWLGKVGWGRRHGTQPYADWASTGGSRHLGPASGVLCLTGLCPSWK